MEDGLRQRVIEKLQKGEELPAEWARFLFPPAAKQYSLEVDAILKAQSRDASRIERCLDGMLDFCFDDEVLALYKKLCRYYFEMCPEAAVYYIHAYREMWDE